MHSTLVIEDHRTAWSFVSGSPGFASPTPIHTSVEDGRLAFPRSPTPSTRHAPRALRDGLQLLSLRLGGTSGTSPTAFLKRYRDRWVGTRGSSSTQRSFSSMTGTWFYCQAGTSFHMGAGQSPLDGIEGVQQCTNRRVAARTPLQVPELQTPDRARRGLSSESKSSGERGGRLVPPAQIEQLSSSDTSSPPGRQGWGRGSRPPQPDRKKGR